MSIYYVVLANKLAGLEVLQRDFISLSAGHYMKTSTTPCMGHNKTAFIITMIKYHHTHTHTQALSKQIRPQQLACNYRNSTKVTHF